MNRASVFEWHERFKEGRESVRDDEKCGGVRKSEHHGWLAKWLGLLCWCFKGVQEEIPSDEASTLQIGSVAFPPGQCTSHNSILVTDYLTKMGINTVPRPPYSQIFLPVTFGYSLSSQAVVMRHLRWKRLWRRSLTRSHKRTSMGLPEVVGTVQQVHCSRWRLLRMGLAFHVFTNNKSAHTKKVWNVFNDPHVYFKKFSLV